MTNREQLMQILAKTFPKMWMKDGTEWNHNSKANFIWTGEGSCWVEIICHSLGSAELEHNLFNYHLTYEKHGTYEMGIHKKLVALLDEHGWYCEWHDAGTVFIYPS